MWPKSPHRWSVKVFVVFDLRLNICLHISWAGSNILYINFNILLEDKMGLQIAALFDNDLWYRSTFLVLNSVVNFFQVLFANVLSTWL